MRHSLIKYISKRRGISLFFLVAILSALSFNVAFDYNFWRDDWKIIWMARYYPIAFIKYVFPSQHPGEIINSIPLVFLFGQNRLLWQVSGYLIKVVASFSVGAATYGLTRSKKAFFISAILFASFFGGLEAYTWMSARLSAFMTITLTLALYFYISSYFENKKLKLILSLLLIYLSLAVEPGRTVFLGGFLLLWEFLQRVVEKKLFNISFFQRTWKVILSVVLGLLSTNLGRSLILGSQSGTFSTFGKGSGGYIERLLANKGEWLTIFNSIGNLIAPYFRKVSVIGGLAATKQPLNAYVGLTFLILVLLIGFYFLVRRNNKAPIFILVPLWIFAYYLPSWIFEPGLVVGAPHRYLAISSVGIIFFVSYLVSLLPKRRVYITVGLLVFIHLLKSFQINVKDYEIRGYKVTQPLYEAQFRMVPPSYTRGIFFVGGKHYLRGYAFDWAGQGKFPYALQKSISRIEDLPIQGTNYEEAGRKVCEANFQEELLGYKFSVINPIPIEKVFGWKVNDWGELENDTDMTRIKVAQASECLSSRLRMDFGEGIVLNSFVYIDKLYEIDRQVISFNWDFLESIDSKVFLDISILDSKGGIIALDTFETEFLKGDIEGYEVPVFMDSFRGKPSIVEILMTKCDRDCRNVYFKKHNLKIESFAIQ